MLKSAPTRDFYFWHVPWSLKIRVQWTQKHKSGQILGTKCRIIFENSLIEQRSETGIRRGFIGPITDSLVRSQETLFCNIRSMWRTKWCFFGTKLNSHSESRGTVFLSVYELPYLKPNGTFQILFKRDFGIYDVQWSYKHIINDGQLWVQTFVNYMSLVRNRVLEGNWSYFYLVLKWCLLPCWIQKTNY